MMAWRRKRRADDPEIPHGARRYNKAACRCDTCRAGHAEAQRRMGRARRAARLPNGVAPKAKHGTSGGYRNHGCLCDACVKAHQDDYRKWYTSRPGYKPPPELKLETRVTRLEPRLDKTTQITRRAPDPNKRVPRTPKRKLPKWTGDEE